MYPVSPRSLAVRLSFLLFCLLLPLPCIAQGNPLTESEILLFWKTAPNTKPYSYINSAVVQRRVAVLPTRNVRARMKGIVPPEVVDSLRQNQHPDYRFTFQIVRFGDGSKILKDSEQRLYDAIYEALGNQSYKMAAVFGHEKSGDDEKHTVDTSITREYLPSLKKDTKDKKPRLYILGNVSKQGARAFLTLRLRFQGKYREWSPTEKKYVPFLSTANIPADIKKRPRIELKFATQDERDESASQIVDNIIQLLREDLTGSL